MYWFIGFLIIFMIGGMSGIFMASPPADFQVHNSLFLVAHFHTMIVGVALFGIFAGTTFWFPKIFGFKLNERLDKQAFWFWFVGFFVAFIPLYLLGFMGAPRRIDHYDFLDRLAAIIYHSNDWIYSYFMRNCHPNLSTYRKHKAKKTTFGHHRRSLEWQNT